MEKIWKPTDPLPTLEELQQSAEDSDYIHVVGLLNPPRPGVRLLFARLEHEHFPPETPRSDLFKTVILEWNLKEWVIMSFPEEDISRIHDVAFQCGLQVIPGVPYMKCSAGLDQFPIIGTGNNVFTLMNPPDHLFYSGKDVEIKAMFDREIFQVLALYQNWDSRN